MRAGAQNDSLKFFYNIYNQWQKFLGHFQKLMYLRHKSLTKHTERRETIFLPPSPLYNVACVWENKFRPLQHWKGGRGVVLQLKQ